MTRTPARGPRLYFNLRSPYSWLALHDLVTFHGELAESVDWRPCWEPDPLSEKLLAEAGGRFPYTPMSREKHFYVLADVRRLAGERGLTITWPVDRSPRWEVAHLAYLAAGPAGPRAGREFAVAVSRARWERGQDISDPAVIAAIAARLGLDGERLAASAGDPRAAANGTRALLNVCADGVFGVPFFICGREKFWGVDRLGAFARCVGEGTPGGQAGPDRQARPPETVAMASSDDGHAGGCG